MSSEYKPSSKACTSAEITDMVDGSDFDQIKWVTESYLKWKLQKALEIVEEYEKQFGYEGMFDPLKEWLADKETAEKKLVDEREPLGPPPPRKGGKSEVRK